MSDDAQAAYLTAFRKAREMADEVDAMLVKLEDMWNKLTDAEKVGLASPACFDT